MSDANKRTLTMRRITAVGRPTGKVILRRTGLNTLGSNVILLYLRRRTGGQQSE